MDVAVVERIGRQRAQQPLLALFVDLVVARLAGPATTAQIAAELAGVGVECSRWELWAVLERMPDVRRTDGHWVPRRVRPTA